LPAKGFGTVQLKAYKYFYLFINTQRFIT
jgi:hypothetical protein